MQCESKRREMILSCMFLTVFVLDKLHQAEKCTNDSLACVRNNDEWTNSPNSVKIKRSFHWHSAHWHKTIKNFALVFILASNNFQVFIQMMLRCFVATQCHRTVLLFPPYTPHHEPSNSIQFRSIFFTHTMMWANIHNYIYLCFTLCSSVHLLHSLVTQHFNMNTISELLKTPSKYSVFRFMLKMQINQPIWFGVASFSLGKIFFWLNHTRRNEIVKKNAMKNARYRFQSSQRTQNSSIEWWLKKEKMSNALVTKKHLCVCGNIVILTIALCNEKKIGENFIKYF